MRLFKEEKEFLNKEVSKKYTSELEVIRKANSKALEDAVKETKAVKNFIQITKGIIPNPETEVDVYDTYVRIKLANDKIELTAKFELESRIETGSSWSHNADSYYYPDAFLNVPLRTKAPKDDNDRFDVISKMIDEIGQEILDKERNSTQKSLEIIKKL